MNKCFLLLNKHLTWYMTPKHRLQPALIGENHFTLTLGKKIKPKLTFVGVRVNIDQYSLANYRFTRTTYIRIQYHHLD